MIWERWSGSDYSYLIGCMENLSCILNVMEIYWYVSKKHAKVQATITPVDNGDTLPFWEIC